MSVLFTIRSGLSGLCCIERRGHLRDTAFRVLTLLEDVTGALTSGASHFSCRIRRGLRMRFPASNSDAIFHGACQNPGGEHVLVLTNIGAKRVALLPMSTQRRLGGNI